MDDDHGLTTILESRAQIQVKINFHDSVMSGCAIYAATCLLWRIYK